MTLSRNLTPIDLLILGAGWTSTFLIPLLKTHHLTFAATTRTGHAIPGLPTTTIPFTFDPESDDEEPYRHLPHANAVLITFPLKGQGQSTRLVEMYESVHSEGKERRRWIQLGSTGVWKGEGWLDRHSPVDVGNPRTVAEEELLALLGKQACVLNLAGLWGGDRDPRNWVERVAKRKEDVKGKGALHLVHGEDVARGIVGCLGKGWEGVGGERWVVDDLRGWDWWDLILGWKGQEGEYGTWVLELMEEEGVRALPRGRERLGRVLDGREFWKTVGLVPSRSLLG
ncbi:MAG: hypothetical protein LQ338_000884 [Usnochroma carphineum]|nr:MAG: hypothetical protein LQ338_000884 [Usnochroma carphineum]